MLEPATPAIADTWVQANRVRLVVGKLPDVVPEVLRAWRVEKLPWLVMTDCDHIVIAEGFSQKELTGEIKEADNAKD